MDASAIKENLGILLAISDQSLDVLLSSNSVEGTNIGVLSSWAALKFLRFLDDLWDPVLGLSNQEHN